MGKSEFTEFLTHLTVKTQSGRFDLESGPQRPVVYSEALQHWLEHVERAKRPSKLPVVFTKDEARVVL